MPFQFSEIQKKIQGVIAGLFGSIMASFGIALGVSALTPDYWVILLSGLIVGVASSFANSFGPLISKSQIVNSQKQTYSKENIMQATASLVLTFIIIILPLVSYLLMRDIIIARTISVMTGLALLFIFGVHRAQLENKPPLLYAFTITSIGAVGAAVCYLIALNFVR